MRFLLAIAIVIAFALMLSACERTHVRLPVTAADTSATDPVVIRAELPGFEGKVTIDPAIALVIELRKKLEPRLRAELAEATVAAQRTIAASTAGPPTPPYFFTSDWSATAIGDRFYDIEGRTEQYTGGAHPNRTVELFAWDRLSDRRLGLADLLKDGAPGSDGMKAFAAAAREALIAVKRERTPGYDPAKDSFITRGAGAGADGASAGDDPFAPDPAKFPSVGLAPGPDGRVGGGLRVVFPLYSVGPYVDGLYDVVVPAEAIAAYLRPEFISQPK